VSAEVQPPVLPGNGLLLRAVTTADRPALAEILRSSEVARWWGDGDVQWLFDDDPGTIQFTVEVAGAVAGLVQFSEETDPMYRHAGLDIFLDPAVHHRGLGREAIRTLATYLFSVRGHHRLVIDPAAENCRAIRAYAAVGFRAVGVLRQYERNHDGTGWHDGLLMELLVDGMN
jgi:aminoglycoside 6'-N-acetyltransferase